MNVILLLDTCNQAGYDTQTIYMEDIVLDADKRFYDEKGEHIDVIFKLYPWEHLVHEEFGLAALYDMETIGYRDSFGNYKGGTIWIEPPYKMLWSNKAIMVILWQLFKDDPRGKYLIPTYFEGDEPSTEVGWARKPLLSREGADITLRNADGTVYDEYLRGEYGEEGYVLQELTLPPVFETEAFGRVWPVLGSWVVDGEPAGMGIRESGRSITDDFSNFVPHSISDGDQTYEHKPVPVVKNA
jgi:glutathionylspermidine synthase